MGIAEPGLNLTQGRLRVAAPYLIEQDWKAIHVGATCGVGRTGEPENAAASRACLPLSIWKALT